MRMASSSTNGRWTDTPRSISYTSPPIATFRAADDRDSRIVEYDLDGHLLYAWGTLSDNPGGLFNTHGMTVDQEGNFLRR